MDLIRSFCLFVVWMTSAVLAFGQYGSPVKPDTVQPDELKENFRCWRMGQPADSTALQNRMVIPDPYDTRCLVYQRDQDLNRKSFFLHTGRPSALADAGKVRIPASCWVLDECYTPAGVRKRLCWYGLRAPLFPGTDSMVLRRRLERRYGKIQVSGVPASWYSGRVAVSSVMDNYCHNWVCYMVGLYRIQKGFVTGYRLLQAFQGSLSCKHFDESSLRGAMGWNWFMGDVELSYLSDMVQRVSGPVDIVGKEEYTFSLLLYTDFRGKSHVHLLEPEQPIVEEQVCFAGLQMAMERLPSGLFGYMLTADGRIFPARYLKAVYKVVDNRWIFQDYLFESKRRVR